MEIEDRKLSPEVEEKLKALRGFTPKSTFFWVHPLEKENLPKEEWTVWKLEGRDGYDCARNEDEMSYRFKEGSVQTNTAIVRYNTLRRHIKGCKGYRDGAGKLVEFSFENDGLSLVPESIAEKITPNEKKQLEILIRAGQGKDELVSKAFMNTVKVEMQRALFEAIADESRLSEEEVEGLKF